MSSLISVIVCTCNRPDLLKTALKTLAEQKTRGEFNYELIVVDNTAAGVMKPAFDEVAPLFKGQARYFIEPQRGKSFALNHGLKRAKGNIFAFTDDDITAEPEWLYKVYKALERHACDGIGGRVLPVYPEDTPQWIKDNAVQLAGGVVIYDYGTEDFLLTEKYYPFIGANFAFKRELFEAYGDFRTDIGPGTAAMGEDTEIVERFLKHGKKLFYCADVLTLHPVDLKRVTLKHMAKWHIALGRFHAKKEMENNLKISSYFFGIPRYLYKGLVWDGLKIVCSVFSRMSFINAWRSFFRRIGLCKEYREKARKSK
jgi:glycosyltransferase involved in cell wall biosynthesis